MGMNFPPGLPNFHMGRLRLVNFRSNALVFARTNVLYRRAPKSILPSIVARFNSLAKFRRQIHQRDRFLDKSVIYVLSHMKYR